MGTFVRVASVSDIPPGGARCVEVRGQRIALFNLRGELHAVDDACPHAGGALSEGRVDDDQVECPRHAGRFDIRTGEALSPPAFEAVRVYRVRVSDDAIELEI